MSLLFVVLLISITVSSPYAIAQTPEGSEETFDEVLSRLQLIKSDLQSINNDQVLNAQTDLLSNQQTLLGLQQNLIDGQESFYRIAQSGVTNAEAVGVFADCPAGVDCVFSVDSIRYNLNDPSAIKVFGFCLDQVNFGDDTVLSNCSPFLHDVMESENSFGLDFEIEFGAVAGIGGKGEISVAPVFGPEQNSAIPIREELSIPLSAPDSIRADFDGEAVGGNILVDSGVGSVMATKFVLVRNSIFSGDVEFLGTQPVGMNLIIGYVTDANNTVCLDADGASIPCPAAFDTALKQIGFGTPSASNVISTLPSDESPITFVDYIDPAQAKITPVVLGGSSSGSIGDVLGRHQGELDTFGTSLGNLADQVSLDEIDGLISNLGTKGLPAKVEGIFVTELAKVPGLLDIVLAETGVGDLQTTVTGINSIVGDIDTAVGRVESTVNGLDIADTFSGLPNTLFDDITNAGTDYTCGVPGAVPGQIATGFVCLSTITLSCPGSGATLIDSVCSRPSECNASAFPNKNAVTGTCFGSVCPSDRNFNVATGRCDKTACPSGSSPGGTLGCVGTLQPEHCHPNVPGGCPVANIHEHCTGSIATFDLECSLHCHPNDPDFCPVTNIHRDCSPSGFIRVGDQCHGTVETTSTTRSCVGGTEEIIAGILTGVCLSNAPPTCPSPYTLGSDNVCRLNLCPSGSTLVVGTDTCQSPAICPTGTALNVISGKCV